MVVFFEIINLIVWISISNDNIELYLWLNVILLGGFLLFMNFPSLILFFNYYLENKHTYFEIDADSNSITIIQKGISKTYNLNDFKKSTYHLAYNYKDTLDHRGRLSMPFSDFGYWDLQFKNGDRYFLTNLLNDFIHDAPKIRKTKYRFRLFPYISKSDSKEGVKLKSIPRQY